MLKKQLINLLKHKGYEIKKIPIADTYIVSFPKSGRTWLNLMLGKFFEQHLGLNNLHPDSLFNLKLFYDFFPTKIPLLLFTHDNNKNFYLPPEKLKSKVSKYKKSKVIFLARDPRDVLISSYFEKTKRIKLGNRQNGFWKAFKGSISDYVYEKNGGFDTILAFYNLWYKNKNIPKNFMLLKYEDLHKNAASQLIKVLNFIEIENIEQKNVETSVQYTLFDNMQKIEQNFEIKSDRLKPADKNDKDTYKTRKGKIGGYINYFSKEEIKYLTDKMNNELSPFFGYGTNL